MAKKTETIEHRICDLCGQETGGDDIVSLHRSDNRIMAARLAAASAMGSQSGQGHVDICPACRARPVSDVLELMYPAQILVTAIHQFRPDIGGVDLITGDDLLWSTSAWPGEPVKLIGGHAPVPASPRWCAAFPTVG